MFLVAITSLLLGSEYLFQGSIQDWSTLKHFYAQVVGMIVIATAILVMEKGEIR
ncbi:hypothetical protein V6Z11_D08G152100 [Gossypium hirsutum]